MKPLLYAFILGAPFIVVFLDLLIDREASRKQRWLGLNAIAIAAGVFWLLHNTQAFSLWILLPGLSALLYSEKLRGLPRYIIVLGWITFCSLFILQLSPSIGSPYSRYFELAAIPVNISYFLLPLLLCWYLWLSLPLVWDSLRGGDWRKTKVPLVAKYQFLAVIALVSIALNSYFYYQRVQDQGVLQRNAHHALMGMYYSLHDISYLLEHVTNEEYPTVDWETRSKDFINNYQRNAEDIARLMRGLGVSTFSGVYLLTTTIPEGLETALTKRDQLSAADAKALQSVIPILMESLQEAIAKQPLHQGTYEQLAVTPPFVSIKTNAQGNGPAMPAPLDSGRASHPLLAK